MTDIQKNQPFWMIPAVLMLLCTLFLAALPRFIQVSDCQEPLALVEAPLRANVQEDNRWSFPADGVSLTKE